jgi:co-chaperonin GroES (HSP10)
MRDKEEKQMANESQAFEQKQKTDSLHQDDNVGTTETHRYRLKDAEPLADNMVIKVANFDQPSTRYYYSPYPMDTNVLVYGEVVAVDPNNEFHIKPGDRVLYNGTVVYQSIEDGFKYVVGPVRNVLLVWRSKTA